MFASALTRRLFSAFVIVLLIFVLLAGTLTALFGSRALRQNYENALMERARATATALASMDSPFLSASDAMEVLPETPPQETGGTHHRQGRGRAHGEERAPAGNRGHNMHGMRGADLRFLDTLLMTNVWILDRQANQIQIGTGAGDVNYQDLDLNAQSIVDQVFAGNEVVSRKFSAFLGDTSLTAGVPVKDTTGAITAALLLHERVEGMEAFLTDTALVLLLTTLLAVVFVLFLSALFARRFSLPLLQMGDVTRRLAAGETGIATDIDQEDEVGALATDIDILSVRLQEAREKEADLENMRRDFSTKLSHELKTPVAIMRSSLEALRDGVISDPLEVQASYDVLYAESRQLDRLITDLLELTALQNPRYPLNQDALDIIQVVNDAIRSQRIFAKEKEMQTKWTAQNDSLPFVGDYGRLRQMFVIVLHNAIKYSPKQATIRIQQGKKEGKMFVSMTNPSPVMDQTTIDQLFTQFYRADDSQKGFGLGLAIAREIAQRHGVEIGVESNAEIGTRFTFWFPRIAHDESGGPLPGQIQP